MELKSSIATGRLNEDQTVKCLHIANENVKDE